MKRPKAASRPTGHKVLAPLPDGRRAGLKDIAAIAGCSARAVSSALRGTPGVSPERREEILRIAEQLNYSPNIMARGLVHSRTYLLGVVMPYIATSFFADILQGIEDRAEQAGYSIVICNSRRKAAATARHIQTLQQRGVDGLLVLVDMEITQSYEALDSFSVPYVQLVRRAPQLRGPAVEIGDEAGAYMATQHLVRLHGQAPLFLAGCPGEAGFPDLRMRGYRRALADAGLSASEAVYEHPVAVWEHGRAAVMDLARRQQLPRAIFAINDYVALGAMRAAYELGIDVPGKLAVVGFDDLDHAWMQWSGCCLTTVRQPKMLVGELGIQMLLGLFAGETVRSVELTPELIVRGSCGG